MNVSSSSASSASYASYASPSARTLPSWKRTLNGILPSSEKAQTKAADRIKANKIENPDFPPWVLDKIQSVLNQCRYGLGAVWQSQDLGLKCLPNYVQIRNYHPTQRNYNPTQFSEDAIIRGDSGSLSAQVGEILFNALKGNQEIYDFLCVPGHYPNAPRSNHYFLLAFPRSKGKDYMKQFTDSPRQIPKDVLIIDPSYGLVGTKAEHPQLSKYSINKNIEKIATHASFAWNALQKKDQIVYYGEASLPMGFSRTLLPESGKNWQEGETGDLVFLDFNKPHDKKPPGLSLIFKNASGKITAKIDDWEHCKLIPRDSQLFQILTLVQNKLNASYCATQAKPTEQKPVQKNKAVAFS
jgi:hypothetical protein